MSAFVKRRSRWAILAALGLVGSLLAVSAVPSAAAGDGRPSNPATYSACVAAATSDAGFTDMDGGHAKAAANCLAHYGITTGTAPGVYSPSAPVTRAQMAVFLARAAGPSGLDLGAAMDQGFSDIGGYSVMFRDAINRVAKAGIMKGTSMTMFSPDASVSRADMAVFLDAFVGKSLIGPGGLGGASKYADVKPDDDPFTDIGGVPFGTYGSIRKVYELGIATGTGNKVFSPDASVTRNQMALFITRALAHTNARPAGLSLQSDKTMTDTSTSGGFALHAAHRSDTHMPMANNTLDLFSAASAGAAFDQDGLCKMLASGVTDPAASSTRCTIDTGDDSTDSDGNLVTEVTGVAGYCAGTKRVWAWTGATNARFDSDTTSAAFVDIGVRRHWRSINASSNLKKHATHVKFGQSITYTLQLVDGGMGKGDAVAQKDVSIDVKFVETALPGSNTRTILRTHKTDASGKVQLTFTYDDPNPSTTGQTVKVVLTGPSGAMGVFLGAAVAAPATGGGGGSPPPGGGGPPRGPGRQGTNPVTIGTLTWSDAAAKAATMAFSQASDYTKATAEGSGARNTIEALVVDQYGDPVSGVPVHFWSNANNGNAGKDDDGLGGRPNMNEAGSVKAPTTPVDQSHLGTEDRFAATVRTNSRGIARHSYFRDSATGRRELIGSVAQIGLRDGAPLAGGGGNNTETDDIYFRDDLTSTPQWDRPLHYWAAAADNNTTINMLFARVFDKAANEIVVQADASSHTIYWVKYDSNDQYKASSDTAVSMDVFENILAVNNRLTIMLASDPIPGVNKFTNTTAAAPASVTPCHD